ncbi:hypothetical protein JZK55_19970 [Dissulfurispira thermophila]|uniref:Uncharacterized protein n=1 Tax=Dissulfurispira thermophila TaxID=2715679 RepID=A0A7G1H2M9_9BACT|nr:YeeE/YedE family protein [Dissulfurispira thermophila]BCB97075.1 hypothetical protein JZK55_19970 [Dissulfurispira thermophila]
MLLSEPYYLFFFNLSVGIILGSIFYRADYCMAGMFRDAFLFRDYSLLRSLILLVVTAMSLFYIMRLSGLIRLYPPPTYSYPSLATIIGGFIFGVGMVLASGCVVGTLYKMAKGNLTNLIAFIGIIAGSLIYAESHMFWESLRTDFILTGNMFLSEDDFIIPLFIVFAASIFFLKWKRQGKWNLEAYATGYIQPWKAAIIIAVLNVFVYIFSGWPMGITTAYAKIGAYIENIFYPEHLQGLSYFSQNSVSINISGINISGGAGPRIDIITFTELALAVGIIAGSFITSLFLREFKIYGLPPKKQAFSAFLGGMLLAYGARIAGGCNLKFIVGALPLLSIQGVVFVSAMTIGAFSGAKIIKKLFL